MNRDKARAIRADLDASLAVIAKKHGLSSLTAGNAKFTDSTVTFLKIEGVEAGGLTAEAQRYNSLRRFHKELPPLGTVLDGGRGKRMKIVGCNTTGSKIMIEDQDGKKYQALPEFLERAPVLEEAK